MEKQKYLQDQLPASHCFGNGILNPQGLKLKSYWRDENTCVCEFKPAAHHCSEFSRHVSARILALLIESQATITATAEAYASTGQPLTAPNMIRYTLGSLQISYLHPALIGQDLVVTASVIEEQGKKTSLYCEVNSATETLVTANAVAIQVLKSP